MKHKQFISFFITLLLAVIPFVLQAQCAMCKGSVQKSQYAKSINNGIEYLLAVPIVLVAGIVILWIKNKDDFK